MWNARQSIEIFHLLFLRQFGSRVDKNLWVLKGGCNLRFFFKSIRYSQDMDIDLRTIARETLRRNVNAILTSPAFAGILKTQKLGIAQYSEPKQTETTQRWKVRLQMLASGQELPTKIEFSRRSIGGEFAFEPADGELLNQYRLSPMLASHYTKQAAFLQKINALAHRSETQARDLFDLKLLIDAGAAREKASGEQIALFNAACERAFALRFDDFLAQVTAYLPPEWQDYYSQRAAWDSLQEVVTDTLHQLATP